MPYREDGRLGRRLSAHRAGAVSWLIAGLMGFAFSPLLIWHVATAERYSMQSVVGIFATAGFGIFAIKEWLRVRAIGIALHERGFLYLSSRTTPLEITWEEVAALEARYVPGLRKKGAADEGNRVALVITTKKGVSIDLPKELDQFFPLCHAIEQHTGKPVTKTVVQNLMQR
jgi:hypothetical protein